MTSSTFSSSRRPSAPPGCEKAKSSAVKPRASSRAIARASPRTRVTVVEEVGARFSGQASWPTLASRFTSAALARGDSGLPVMLIRVMPRRLIRGNRVTISAVEPELDRARTTSSLVIMPMSPWLASAGCTKKEGVPVLARVAAIFLPTWPDLPMPTTTTRPLPASSSSQALTKSSPIRASRLSTASRSRPMVRWAEWMKSRFWLMFNECGAWIKGGIITGKRAPLTPAMLRSRSASPRRNVVWTAMLCYAAVICTPRS